jgi:NAD(P)-dependent dehydrogenase (short-subunit alcohol dehydrogenase family)
MVCGSEEGRAPQRGTIVNCASVNSIVSLRGTVPYTISKHAVVGITKAAALEAREHGIRVNAISPGFLLTQLLASRVTDDDGKPVDMWTGFEARQGGSARFEVAVLITSPRMSLVNGVNLSVDG